jgi:hypothetical protein
MAGFLSVMLFAGAIEQGVRRVDPIGSVRAGARMCDSDAHFKRRATLDPWPKGSTALPLFAMPC